MSLAKFPDVKYGTENLSYPASLEQLQKAYDYEKDIISRASLFDCFLKEKLPLTLKQGAKTNDGYGWFCAIEYKNGERTLYILLPWSQDWDKKDGSESDRAIAVANKGMSEMERDEIISKIVKAVKTRLYSAW